MLVGTSDADQVFHPFAISVNKGESAGDFEFTFRALKAFDPEWAPRILLADGSDAITAGFRAVFGNPELRLMCFFHVTFNLEKFYKGLSKHRKYLEMRRDIHYLQTCKDEGTFLKASELFMKK